MKRIEYRTFDKGPWGPGPWQDEPDKVQWPDEDTGLPCMMVRNDFGVWCGYVGVAEGHPWFETGRGEIEADVHGDVTFAAFCRHQGNEATDICHVPEPGDPDRVWWIGFDCNHAWDFAPGMDFMLGGIPSTLARMSSPPLRVRIFSNSVYRDVAFVEAEIRKLAAQAAAAAAK